MVTIEISAEPGVIGLVISAPGDDATVMVAMTPDEAREFSNSIGEAILAASRSGVLT